MTDITKPADGERPRKKPRAGLATAREAALRENLLKRKRQQRARTHTQKQESE